MINFLQKITKKIIKLPKTTDGYHLIYGIKYEDLSCGHDEPDLYRYFIAKYSDNFDEWVSDNGDEISNVIFIKKLSSQPERLSEKTPQGDAIV